MKKRDFIWIGMVFMFFLPVQAEGRFINLGGSLDVSYGETKTAQGNQTQETSFFQQRYSLYNFGEIFNPRIGTLLMSGTYQTQDADTDTDSGDQDFEFNDYAAYMTLIPYISPISLHYSHTNRINKIDPVGLQSGMTVKDRITTFGGNWAFSVPLLPRLFVSYNQSELEADDPARLPNTINRFFNLESSGRVRETTLIGRYQYQKADIASFGSASSKERGGHSYTLNTESRPAPAFILTTNWRWSDPLSAGHAPGVSIRPERGFGATASYTPSVKWGTHARVNLSETPSSSAGPGISQQNAFWSGTYRPAEELDMVMSARYFRYDISGAETTSPFIDYSLNYRPFFGFSSGFGASYGMTETKGGDNEISTDFVRYRGNLEYTRAIESIRYSSRYSLSHGLSDTDGQGESEDLMHTLSFTVENTRFQYAHLTFGYTLNDLTRSHTGDNQQVVGTGDQLSHLFQLNADSNYFRGLLRDDDSLLLQSTASYTKIDGFGAAGENFALDGRGTYYFYPGAMLSAGYTYQNYPGGFYSDSHIFYEELHWSFVIGDTAFSFSARASQERSSGNNSLDRDTLQTTGGLTYNIGKFLLSADARWGIDTSHSTDDVDFENQAFFVRASRSF